MAVPDFTSSTSEGIDASNEMMTQPTNVKSLLATAKPPKMT